MLIEWKAKGTVAKMWADNDPEQFVNSYTQALLFSQMSLCGPREFLYPAWARLSWHESARNGLAEEALGDWILMLDTDHEFAPDVLTRLLYLRQKHSTRVLSAIYLNKHVHIPVANIWGPNNSIHQLTEWDWNADIVEVGPVGAGCLLIDTSVFKDINKHLDGVAPFSIIQGLSEDYSFCLRCRQLGIPIYLAPKVESHHLGHRNPLRVEDYVLAARELQAKVPIPLNG